MLRAFIYKHPRTASSSNDDRISARLDEVTIVNADGPDEPRPHAPPVVIESHRMGVVRAIPARKNDAGLWVPIEGEGVTWAPGGSYIGTPDSRFTEACIRILVAKVMGAMARGLTQEELMAAQGFAGGVGVGGGVSMPGLGWGMVDFYGAVALHDRKES